MPATGSRAAPTPPPSRSAPPQRRFSWWRLVVYSVVLLALNWTLVSAFLPGSTAHRHELDALASALLAHETLDHDDVLRVTGLPGNDGVQPEPVLAATGNGSHVNGLAG